MTKKSEKFCLFRYCSAQNGVPDESERQLRGRDFAAKTRVPLYDLNANDSCGDKDEVQGTLRRSAPDSYIMQAGTLMMCGRPDYAVGKCKQTVRRAKVLRWIRATI